MGRDESNSTLEDVQSPEPRGGEGPADLPEDSSPAIAPDSSTEPIGLGRALSENVSAPIDDPPAETEAPEVVAVQPEVIEMALHAPSEVTFAVVKPIGREHWLVDTEVSRPVEREPVVPALVVNHGGFDASFEVEEALEAVRGDLDGTRDLDEPVVLLFVETSDDGRVADLICYAGSLRSLARCDVRADEA